MNKLITLLPIMTISLFAECKFLMRMGFSSAKVVIGNSIEATMKLVDKIHGYQDKFGFSLFLLFQMPHHTKDTSRQGFIDVVEGKGNPFFLDDLTFEYPSDESK